MAVTPDIERPIIADIKSVRSVVSTREEKERGPLLKVNAFVTRCAPLLGISSLPFFFYFFYFNGFMIEESGRKTRLEPQRALQTEYG